MPSEQILIRVAVDMDLPQLITMAQRYVDEADRYSVLNFNPTKAVTYAAMAINDKDQQIFIATDKGKLVGFMWSAIKGQVWTDNPIAGDLFLFVDKEYRSLGIGARLVIECEKWIKACGVHLIMNGANSGIGNDAGASNTYKSLGYTSGGNSFIKYI